MTANDAPALDEMVERIIEQAYSAADAAGEDRPGRPTLVALVRQQLPEYEITEHQVRKAKRAVEAEPASPPAPVTSDAPAATSTSPPDLERARQHAARPLVLWPQTTAHRLAAVNQRLAETLETASAPEPPPAPRQPAARAPRPWPLALIGLAAAVAVWSGWVGLGEMAGFGPINVLPGIGSGWTINSAIVLPISVEAYAAYALRVWLSTAHHSTRTIAFARTSTVTSLVVGGAAQVAYHLLEAAGYTRAPWVVTMLVSLVPVLVLGIASALAKLVAGDRQAGGAR